MRNGKMTMLEQAQCMIDLKDQRIKVLESMFIVVSTALRETEKCSRMALMAVEEIVKKAERDNE